MLETRGGGTRGRQEMSLSAGTKTSWGDMGSCGLALTPKARWVVLAFSSRTSLQATGLFVVLISLKAV